MLNKRVNLKTCATVAIALAVVSIVRAQPIDKEKAAKIKAAYLYNFAKFIEWPDDAFEDEKAPFVIGVLGVDPFGHILDDTVKSKNIASRVIEVRRFDWNKAGDREAMRQCHILFISSSEKHRLRAINVALKEHPLLTVSDTDDFAVDGGMIELTLEQGKIVFAINREVLKKADLRADSQLLGLARIVTTRRP